jgi:hypothetical protein
MVVPDEVAGGPLALASGEGVGLRLSQGEEAGGIIDRRAANGSHRQKLICESLGNVK